MELLRRVLGGYITVLNMYRPKVEVLINAILSPLKGLSFEK